MIDWDEAAAAHLLRRAGFGAPPSEVARAVRRGRVRTVDALLAFRPSSARYTGDGDYRSVSRWWIQRMLAAKHPLQEKLTLFWHGHFATAVSKVEDVRLLSAQNATLRRNAGGRFRDLLVAVSRDPAMIFWLDNLTNEKGSPNENYAREVMELFTLGIRDRDGNENYTQADVRDLARCFTGWNVEEGRYAFLADLHDSDAKTVLGVAVPARAAEAGEQDALDVIDHIVASERSAQFVVAKLWSYFAYPDPERALVDDLAAVYLARATDVRALLRAMFLRDEFHSERALTERVSPPAEFVAGTLRTLRAKVRPDPLPQALSDMGQELLNPPNVAGWPGGLAWMTSVTRLHRLNFAWECASGRDRDASVRADLRQFVKRLPRTGASAALVDRVTSRLGLRISPETRQQLIGYLDDVPPESGEPVPFDPKDPEHADVKVRGLLGLALSIPEAYLV